VNTLPTAVCDLARKRAGAYVRRPRMFHGPAQSFAQQARLAIWLSLIAGYTNALTVLLCGQVTSHLTGAVAKFGVEAASGNLAVAGYFFLLVAVFGGGAFAAGVLLELGRVRGANSIYMLPMAVEAALLLGFTVLVDWHAVGKLPPERAQAWLTLLPAFAMGLQNAAITRISGGVVRTTHVTGVVTDLGLDLARLSFGWLGLGRRLAPVRARQAKWRTVLLATIPLAFAVGAALGTLAFAWWTEWAMAPACAALVVVVAAAALAPVATVTLRPTTNDVGEAVAWFRAEPPAGCKQFHLPDVSTWSSQLPANVHVVVLDIAAMADMVPRTASELRMLQQHLRDEDRHLVLANLVTTQLETMEDAGVLLDFDADDLCGEASTAMQRAQWLLAHREAWGRPQG
jgi:uncharacterized membrane protein YoaK (UPF0700 family)